MKTRTTFLLTVGALLVLVLGACVAPAVPAAESGAEEAPMDDMACAEVTPVKLQLQWVTQSQFACGGLGDGGNCRLKARRRWPRSVRRRSEQRWSIRSCR